MPKYKVTVWASYETEVEAYDEDEAEETALNEAPFPYADSIEVEEIVES